ncbi:hypothetical protein [Clostridium botulinum]|uniref:Uncharacterized protein n=1 Tax=Clostridium botulinum CFSAN001627 TaxID=1232189 RepID=M1ZZE5_CLOBO|nr:hypothetical protein [Clostridium botulinum]EKN42945.1 hypothetical protein CFSAN001627_03470 [Clostridium botulinum CFSAN001627]APC82252.1 hypothetical protein NPD12_3802 [Clostridium botulinum]AXG97802.1 hypothetical protein AGE31_19630 [Clostridium botulinum]MBY6773549.1 hypothetical protein [Clostridium botulinum]MBY6850421.1 hypothetical protein [Clostridium botulinum]
MEIMQKQEFNNLKIEQQIQYINNLLEEGYTLTKACKSIGIARSTIGGRFSKEGYKYNEILHLYCKNNANVEEVIKPKEITLENTLQKQDNINNANIMQNTLTEIMPVLLEMVEWYKNKNNLEERAIDLEPIEINLNAKELGGAISTHSLRCYESAYVEFQKTCEQYKGYKKQDLLSSALLEFAKKYRK